MLSSHVFFNSYIINCQYVIWDSCIVFFFSAQSEYEIDQRLLEYYKMIV